MASHKNKLDNNPQVKNKQALQVIVMSIRLPTPMQISSVHTVQIWGIPSLNVEKNFGLNLIKVVRTALKVINYNNSNNFKYERVKVIIGFGWNHFYC